MTDTPAASKTIDKVAWVHIKDGRLLLVKSRNKDAFYMPGEKRDLGESDIDCLKREIQEELGVTLKSDTIQFLEEFRAQAHGKPEGVFVVEKCYDVEYEGTLTPQSEIESLEWFTSKEREQLTPIGKLIFDWLKEKRLIT